MQADNACILFIRLSVTARINYGSNICSLRTYDPEFIAYLAEREESKNMTMNEARTYRGDARAIPCKEGDVVAILSGRITKKGVSDLSTTGAGVNVCSASISVQNQTKELKRMKEMVGGNDFYHTGGTDGSEYDVVRLNFWRWDAERASQHLHAGDVILAVGRMSQGRPRQDGTIGTPEMSVGYYRVLKASQNVQDSGYTADIKYTEPDYESGYAPDGFYSDPYNV